MIRPERSFNMKSKKVLYISNIAVPYRTEFFNQVAQNTDLTVLYERKKSANRDEKWSRQNASKYDIKYLSGISYKNEYTLSLGILRYLFSKKYDTVVFGCYNSPSQMIGIMLMKLFHKKYILNLDGEYFYQGKGLKKAVKRFFLRDADKYIVAGKKVAQRLSGYVAKDRIYPYNFSSLTQNELSENAKSVNHNTNSKVLVIGQYFDYKGLDIALECAKLDTSIEYRFIGAGKRNGLLMQKVNEMRLKNVDVVPFLQKQKLAFEYQNCELMLLPSRKECWGLVVNEAASFGCPIVSSDGSGAGVEFLSDNYPQFLAKSEDPNDMLKCIRRLKEYADIDTYKRDLITISGKYSIEENVAVFLDAVNGDKK